MKEKQQIIADIAEAIDRAAQQYSAKKMCAALNLTPECINPTDALIQKFCGMDIEEAVAVVAEWARKCLKAPQWIDVKDALPDEYEYVLGVTLEPAWPSYAIVHLVHGKWYTSDGDEIEPTCWMRLPECQYIDAEYGGKDYEN